MTTITTTLRRRLATAIFAIALPVLGACGGGSADPVVEACERFDECNVLNAGVSVDDIKAETIATIPMGRLIESEDLANAVLFFCSPLADIVTGQAIAVDGGSGEAINY